MRGVNSFHSSFTSNLALEWFGVLAYVVKQPRSPRGALEFLIIGADVPCELPGQLPNLYKV
jgi:hypothetical protein